MSSILQLGLKLGNLQSVILFDFFLILNFISFLDVLFIQFHNLSSVLKLDRSILLNVHYWIRFNWRQVYADDAHSISYVLAMILICYLLQLCWCLNYMRSFMKTNPYGNYVIIWENSVKSSFVFGHIQLMPYLLRMCCYLNNISRSMRKTTLMAITS